MNGSAQASHSLLVLLTIFLVVAMLHFAQDVLIPLALALLMTFLLAPLVDRLEHWGVNRAFAVLIAVTFAFTVVGGIIYIVLNQFADLIQDLPRYRRQLRANILDLSGLLRGGVSETTSAVEQLTEELKAAAPAAPEAERIPRVQVVPPPPDAMEALRALVTPIIKPLGTAALVLVFVIYMLMRFADLRDRLIRLLGARNLRATTEALTDAAKRVSRYLLMQTLINGAQGVMVAIGLSLIGLPNAILWGALTLVLRFIPYIGPWVAAAMPIALSFAVFDNWTYPLLTIALFVTLEAISNMLLEPWLYGSNTGVSTVALLVAAAFWTWLWGAVGLFLAIPLTVCLVVMGKYIPQLEFLHVLLSDQPVLKPHQRLYQRLLAGSRDDADDLLDEALRTQSLLEVCDAVVVPAMQLAEEDHDRGALKDLPRQQVLEQLEQWADERMEMATPLVCETDEPRPENSATVVLCLPATDLADEISAKLFTAVLIEMGIAARICTLSEARAQINDLQRNESKPSVVVVSALPPDAVVHARYVCKRVRRALGETLLIVGLWHPQGDGQRSRQRLEAAGATKVVNNFNECLEHIRTGISAVEATTAAAAGQESSDAVAHA